MISRLMANKASGQISERERPSEVWSERGPLFCPVARALDLMGDRWTLVLVRHLLGGPKGFQEIRTRTGIAPRMLATRLRQMKARGFVEPVQIGNRTLYGLTERGRTLAPVVRDIARWWVLNAMETTGEFSETSAVSVVESLPFLLKEDRAMGVQVTYELRLKGPGGGVWMVEIDDGTCRVREGFAERADIRYTADAREWCAIAIGLADDRAAFRSGRLVKEGQGGSMAWYFHQIRRPEGQSEGEER
jgi:DNA-binding HxlR family transcriptional regulator